VLQLEVLVGELGSVDGLAPGAVVVGEVTTLKTNKTILKKAASCFDLKMLDLLDA